MRKLCVCLLTAALMLGMAFSASAAEKDDYTALKWATSVTDSGNNTVQVAGKGVMNNANPDEECGIIFKEKVDVKGFKATMRFDKSYGAGAQDGWYAINFNSKPTGLSSVTSTIKAKNIKGVNIIFKLDNGNKKKVNLELSRYNSQSGFKHIYGQTVVAENLTTDWTVDVEIKSNGDLMINGEKFGELGDAIDLSFPDNQAYVGFIGFSENMNDVGFTVTYAQKLSAGSGNNTSSAAVSSQPKTSSQNVSSSKSQTVVGSSSSASVSASESTVSNAPETTSSEEETDVTVSEPAEDASENESNNEDDTASAPAVSDSQETSSNAPAAGGSDNSNGSAWIWIVLAVVVVVIAGGVISFVVIKKKKQ